jgi:hypothetical protein
MHISQKSTMTKLFSARENPPKIIKSYFWWLGKVVENKKFLIFDSIFWLLKIRNYYFWKPKGGHGRLFSVAVENKAYFLKNFQWTKNCYFRRHWLLKIDFL